jgi:hypothetical protein
MYQKEKDILKELDLVQYNCTPQFIYNSLRILARIIKERAVYTPNRHKKIQFEINANELDKKASFFQKEW